jgi:hypothetical protein
MPKIEQGAKIYIPAIVVETKDASNIVVTACGAHIRIAHDLLDRESVSEEAVRELVELERDAKGRIRELEARIEVLGKAPPEPEGPPPPSGEAPPVEE